jgi:hypothetical protein
MIQSSNANAETRKEIVEIRKEISALHHCVKDHHARISVIESRG